MPVEATNPSACQALCRNHSECLAYTHHQAGCSGQGEACALPGGCCWLKGPGFARNRFSPCACSQQLRPLPDGSEAPSLHGFGNLSRCRESAELTKSPTPPSGAKSVLYIIVDDLRPELTAYGRKVPAPNVQGLADGGMVFDRAYCNIAVCSPSRVSFLTGRSPTTSHTYNFINHPRQATCAPEAVRPLESYTGEPIRVTRVTKDMGGAGECCTQCTYNDACHFWSFVDRACLQFAEVNGTKPAEGISGARGAFQGLTTLPENFRKQGYLVLSSGKIFHTEQGGSLPGGQELGLGNPPNEDPQSWSPGCSMDVPNLVADNWACAPQDRMYGLEPGCPVNATLDGTILDPMEPEPFEDKVIADEALKKLAIAADHVERTGRPFFLAVGFRKPHMPWRFPLPWLESLPPLEETDTALHPTLDPSVPCIAHHAPDLQVDPFHFPNDDFNLTQARAARLFYRAAVAWMDSQLGRVLDALERSGLAGETLVALHGDHGWSLGEHGQWQKFTNWEVGVRTPLVLRAPWLPKSAGRRSSALVELVDMYRTVTELAGISMPAEAIDGRSLAKVVRDGTGQVRDAALSVFPRCPKIGGNDKDFGPFNSNASEFWQNNFCELVDRSMIPWMGYSMRTELWRYTEWVAWDGHRLQPDFQKPLAGRELYNHDGDDGTDYDAFENENLADLPEYASVVASLSQKLRAMAMTNQESLIV